MHQKLERLVLEADALEKVREQLVLTHRTGHALVHESQVIGVFPTWEAAFKEALDRYGTKGTYLIGQIDAPGDEAAPALVLGLLDPTTT